MPIGIFVRISHPRKVLLTGLSNSEIWYKKLCGVLTGCAYAPYTLCISPPLMPLTSTKVTRPSPSTSPELVSE